VEAQDHYEPTGVFSLPAYSARVPYFYTPSCGGLVTAFLKFKKEVVWGSVGIGDWDSFCRDVTI
jgi:hypothetical protein